MSDELPPLNVEWTNVFKRDYKRALKRNLDISLLDDIIGKLSRREPLPPSNKDHPLRNNWLGFRECHIMPDWLLIYRKDDHADDERHVPARQRRGRLAVMSVQKREKRNADARA